MPTRCPTDLINTLSTARQYRGTKRLLLTDLREAIGRKCPLQLGLGVRGQWPPGQGSAFAVGGWKDRLPLGRTCGRKNMHGFAASSNDQPSAENMLPLRGLHAGDFVEVIEDKTMPARDDPTKHVMVATDLIHYRYRYRGISRGPEGLRSRMIMYALNSKIPRKSKGHFIRADGPRGCLTMIRWWNEAAEGRAHVALLKWGGVIEQRRKNFRRKPPGFPKKALRLAAHSATETLDGRPISQI